MAAYHLAPAPPEEMGTELSAYTPLVQQLLFIRGITTATAAAAFLAPDYEAQLHSPELLHDISKAVARIEKAMAAAEPIVIYSDYDCDGIPGGVILHDFFTAVGYEHFTNYIPHRHYEGFGLSVSAVEKLAAEGAKLIITIDCGTSDVEAVAKANELGVDVIITDHHEPGARLPQAAALINPKLGDYPFPDLCGAATVFKLAQALIASGNYALTPGQEKWWLDMVGLATIADMVPLIGENRVLAHYGLTVLRKSRRPGLQQLLRKAGTSQQHLTEDDIGFTIGPRINAASRMDKPEDAFWLLASRDEGEAGTRVAHLEALNQTRKTTVAQMTRELHVRLKELNELPPVLVFGNPAWRPSLVGLAATKLAAEHDRPVFLWGRDGNGAHKGSCRSGGGISVVTLMETGAAAFAEYGGHHMSGGFTIAEDRIFDFSKLLVEAYHTLGEAAQIAEPTTIDATLDLNELHKVLEELRPLAPFGMGNPKPLFQCESITPESVEQFGKTKEHLKLTIRTKNGTVEAIAFFATPEVFTTTPEASKACTLLVHIEESYFRASREVRVRIVDVV